MQQNEEDASISREHTRDVREDNYEDEKAKGEVTQINVSSVALAAAIRAEKPSPLSKNMLKLYILMSVGYLVSTMVGFGEQFSLPSSLSDQVFTILL